VRDGGGFSIFARGRHYEKRHFATWTVLALVAMVASILTSLPTAVSDAASAGDGVVVYGLNGDSTPRARTYSSSGNSVSSQAATVAGVAGRVFATESSPTQQELLTAYTDATGYLRLLCFDGTNWVQEWTSPAVIGVSSDRRFNIAFEKTTGDAMVVYSANAATTNELKYRTKPGSVGCGASNWSPETSLDPARTSGTVAWVKMASNPLAGSNVIAMAWTDNSNDLSAMMWNGSAWSNEPNPALSTTVEQASAPADVDAFDLAYETSSGDLMLAWGDIAGADGVAGGRYATCTGGTEACTWSAAQTVSAIADDTTNLDLAASPSSDEIVLATNGNASGDIGAAYWNGASWAGTTGIDNSATTVSPNHRNVAAGWFQNGSTLRSLVVYADADAGGLSYITGNAGTFTVQSDWTTSPVMTGAFNWGEIDTDPANPERGIFSVAASTTLYLKRIAMDAAGAFTLTNADGGASLGTLTQATMGAFGYSYWNNVTPPTVLSQRSNTVEFFGGQHTGATGAMQNLRNAFPEQTYELAETGASVKNAYVEVSAQVGTNTTQDYASAYIYFDQCTVSCTANATTAYTTTGSLGSTPHDSHFIRFRADVTAEADVAAYNGAGLDQKFQVAYCFATGASCSGTQAANIFGAHAKLVVTYTYNTTSANRTNTVRYPLESAAGVGSLVTNQASCTINSNCPKFSYNADIPELASRISQQFHVQNYADQESTGDMQVTPQVDGFASGSPVHIEGTQGAQGGWHDWRFSGLTGYADNTSQQLELGLTGASAYNNVLGGENVVTYSHAANAATRTKTVSYPVGEVVTALGSTTKSALTGPNVYVPETGASIKKAWFRINTGATAGDGTLSITTKVGANAESSATTYTLNGDSEVSQDGFFNHMIPSSNYAALETATANNGIPAQMTAKWQTNAGGNVSAELVVTYQFTGDTNAYQTTQTVLAGQQTAAPATTYTTTAGAVDTFMPDNAGTIAVRGASLLVNAKNNGTTSGEGIGSNLTTAACSASTTSTVEVATAISRIMLWKDLTSVVTNADSTTYTACYATTQGSVFSGVLTLTYQVSTENAGVVFAQTAGGANQATGTTLTQAFSGTNTAGNAIVVAASWNSTGSNRSVTCTDTSNNDYQTAIIQNDATKVQAVAICYATNIKAAAAGANTVTVTYGATATTRRLIVHEYSGMASIGAYDQVNANVAAATSTAPTSNSVTTTANGDLVFSALMTHNVTTVSAGSGYVKRLGTTGTTSNDFATEDRVLSAAGSTSATWSLSSTQPYSAIVLALRSELNAPDNGAVRHTTKSSGVSSTTLATPVTMVEGGNTLVVAVSWKNNSTLTCSDSGSSTWTNVFTAYDATSTTSIGVCYATGVPDGTITVTATFGSASATNRMVVTEYEGLNAAYPVDVSASQANVTTTSANAGTSTAASTTVAGDLIYGVFMEPAGALSNAGTNFTRQTAVNGVELATQDYIQTSAGSIAATQTFSVASNRYLAGMVAFRRMPTLTQSNWRLFANANSADVGAALAAQNTTATGIATGGQFRLRIRATVGQATYYSGPLLKLQYAQMSGSCDTAFVGESYSTVSSGSGAIRFYDNAGVSDSVVATANANDPTGNTKIMESYEESGNTAVLNTIAPGQDGLWDFSLVNTAGAAFTSYCFRMVLSTSGPIDAYSTVAQITTGAANQNPNAPTQVSLAQKRSDQSTVIPTGGYTNQTEVWLDAAVVDPDAADTVSLCAEVESTLTSPASPATCGALSTNNTTRTVNVTGLSSGTAYKWQVKSKDNSGAYSSSYTQFNSGSTAFTVDTAAPAGGSVNDGAASSSDATYNTGSLKSLSCNWSGFSDGISGVARYDVSFGTTAGSTNVSTGATGATSGWFTNAGALNAGWYTYTSADVLTLHTSQQYFCNVRAVDGAGNTVSVSSDGQFVAPTLSFSASTQTLNFTTLSSSNGYTNSQPVTLTTSTNGYGGYDISLYATGTLSSGSSSIAAYGSSWNSPTVWPSGSGFGYTSTDTNVSGSNRFLGATRYAGVPVGAGSSHVVADHTTAVDGAVDGNPITNEAHTLTFKVAANATQPAGAYRTTLVFSVTANF
jgi:hypothetical protein